MNYSGVYKKDGFSAYSKEEQQKLFDILNATFQKDKNTTLEKLNKFFDEAQNNNLAVIDYLSSLYFNGEVVEPNLYFATCLSIYAGANGSKLSLNRLHDLLDNTLSDMVNSINKEKLFASFNLNETSYEEFLLNHICSSLLLNLSLSLDSILAMRTHLNDFDEFMVLDIEDACRDNLESMIMMLGDVK